MVIDTDSDEQTLGKLIQSYARARWGDKPDREAADELSRQLVRELRDRIDMLGFDAECLLAVSEDDVIGELGALEKKAALEDADVRTKAARVRAREEMQIDDPAKASWRNRRVPQGKHHPSTRHGRRGERGQR